MYQVGQEINIGYYGGFRHRELIKTKATIYFVDGDFIKIKVHLSHGGFRRMFGFSSELKQLEENYYKN